ncbi:MAG: TetR/AcrR family transcriptional regulator [Chloroflexi bacterium]|nr:TetR/AcrR family transcriptional regulator [Chloroflexota bacterium]
MPEHSEQAATTGTEATRGRPRDPEADRAILQATIELLGEIGFSAMSIEGVAARSGVAKTTIYRRFNSKLELVLNAMNRSLAIDEIPDTGSLRGDIKAMIMNPGGMLFLAGRGAAIIGTLLVERENNPELLEPFHRLIFEPRQRQLRQIIERARKRGEIGPEADYMFVGASLIGSVVVSSLTGNVIDEEAVERLMDNVCRSMGAGQPKP